MTNQTTINMQKIETSCGKEYRFSVNGQGNLVLFQDNNEVKIPTEIWERVKHFGDLAIEDFDAKHVLEETPEPAPLPVFSSVNTSDTPDDELPF